jgi:rubrerythrin
MYFSVPQPHSVPWTETPSGSAPFFPSPVDPSLVSDIEKAIDGQYTAIACYAQLIREAPAEPARIIIEEIRNDEIRHYHTFIRIYTSLTGRAPTPKITEKCPADYRQGLVAAFLDEQRTTDFYRDIADKARRSDIAEAFRRAAEDEQHHAVWFLYLLTGER